MRVAFEITEKIFHLPRKALSFRALRGFLYLAETPIFRSGNFVPGLSVWDFRGVFLYLEFV